MKGFGIRGAATSTRLEGLVDRTVSSCLGGLRSKGMNEGDSGCEK